MSYETSIEHFIEYYCTCEGLETRTKVAGHTDCEDCGRELIRDKDVLEKAIAEKRKIAELKSNPIYQSIPNLAEDILNTSRKIRQQTENTYDKVEGGQLDFSPVEEKVYINPNTGDILN